MSSAAVVTNLLEASTPTASAEAAAYPIEYIFDRIAAKPFGFGNTTGGNLDFDLGAAKDFDTFALVNHNLTSGATVQVKADSFSPATTVRATMTYRAGAMWADLTSLTLQHVRVTITDSAAANLTIGEAVLGERIVLPRAPQYGIIPGKMRSQILHETPRKVIHAYALSEQEIREYTWRVLAAEIADFETVNDAVAGRLAPLLWIPDVTAAEVLYARLLDKDFRPRELSDPVRSLGSDEAAYDLVWRLLAESYGKEITA